MRTYETTFIINPQTDDATLEKHVTDVASIITASKGKILHKNSMGTRRLAYEINGLTQGYYANFLFEAPSDVLPRLDKHFKTNEMYLRNLTIKFEGDLERHLKSLQNPYADSRPTDGPGRDEEHRSESHKAVVSEKPVAVEPEENVDRNETVDTDDETSEDEL